MLTYRRGTICRCFLSVSTQLASEYAESDIHNFEPAMYIYGMPHTICHKVGGDKPLLGFQSDKWLLIQILCCQLVGCGGLLVVYSPQGIFSNIGICYKTLFCTNIINTNSVVTLSEVLYRHNSQVLLHHVLFICIYM